MYVLQGKGILTMDTKRGKSVVVAAFVHIFLATDLPLPPIYPGLPYREIVIQVQTVQLSLAS